MFMHFFNKFVFVQDVYEQTGVFINVPNDDGNGGDLLLGGSLYITRVVSA